MTARDPGGLTATQTFSVNVQQSNRSPEATGRTPDHTVIVGRLVTIDVTRFFSDPDGDVLTYSTTSAIPEPRKPIPRPEPPAPAREAFAPRAPSPLPRGRT